MKHDMSLPRRHMMGASLGTLAAAGLATLTRGVSEVNLINKRNFSSLFSSKIKINISIILITISPRNKSKNFTVILIK